VLLALAPPVADQDNAAPIYEEAFAALTPVDQLPPHQRQKMTAWHRAMFDWDWGDWSRDMADKFDLEDQDLTAFLRSQEKGLALLRRAAAKPACSLLLGNPIKGFGDKKIANLADLLSRCVDLLTMDALAKAGGGDPHAALEDIEAILGMNRHALSYFPADPRGRSWRVFQVVLNQASPRLEDLAKLPFDDSAPELKLFRRQEAFLAIFTLSALLPEQSSTWYWWWTNEVLHRRKWQPLPKGFNAPFAYEAAFVPAWRVFLVPDDLEYIHRTLEEYQEFARSPQRAAFPSWQDAVQSLRVQQGGVFFVHFIKPKLEANVRWTCDVATLRWLAQTAVAVKAYQAKHGKYPEKLEDLVPVFLKEIPTDPWDGHRLRLKQTPKEVILYTARNPTEEPDTKRDDGEHRRDIVFRVR
jgi:hypothetical protein